MRKTILMIGFYIICLSIFSFYTVPSFATPNDDIIPQNALDNLRDMEGALRDTRDDVQDGWDVVDKVSISWEAAEDEAQRQNLGSAVEKVLSDGTLLTACKLLGILESDPEQALKEYYKYLSLMDLYSDVLEALKREIDHFHGGVRLYKSAHKHAEKTVNSHHTNHHQSGSVNHIVPSLKTKTCRDSLPSFSCRGNHAAGKTVCNESYNTPKKAFYTHREVCGEEEDAYYTNRNSIRTHISGDNIAYYTCDPVGNARHRVRSCTRDFTDGSGVTSTCGDGFRRCVGHKKDHDHSNIWNWETKHSDEADSSTASASPGFAPSSGSYTASAGDTHTGTVTASSIYGAYLYVNGVQQSWFSGSTAATSLSLTYTFASDASGSYTMMARVYPWNGSTYGNYTDYSYTVTVGSTTTPTSTPSTPSTPTTPSYHTCGVHETSVSGTHSAAGCGVSGHYVCDGSNHLLQASCTTTNASGQYCTVSSFYACQSHTHVYPQTYTCNGCSGTVTSKLIHLKRCSGCNKLYYECKAYGLWWHTQVETCRRPGCGQTFTRCSNGTCTSDWGTSSTHWRR